MAEEDEFIRQMGGKGGYDVALTEDDRGGSVLHWVNCRIARCRAGLGYPVYNMFGCQGLPDNIRKCDCMVKRYPELGKKA